MTKLRLLTIIGLLFLMGGCATINLGPSFNKPIKEQVIEEGKTDKKVLIIQIDGLIDDQPKEGVFSNAPSILDSLMMQLKKAEKDDKIVTVILKINSPGGGVTVSDAIYHELAQFKKRTGKKLFVQMMTIAASGGVYVSMAADHIQAHPSTITGSIGVITVTADLSATMDKIGAKVNVYKSGINKDMGSPFKPVTETDKKAFQSMVDDMASNFYQLISENRSIDDKNMELLKTARVMSGTEAYKIGLVDSLGYLSDATEKACALGAAKECQVVSYRFSENQNANAYSPSMAAPSAQKIEIIDLPILQNLKLNSGVYHLYLQ